MISVTKDYLDNIYSDGRRFVGKVEIGAGEDLLAFTGADALKEFEVTELVNKGDDLTVGSACSAELTLTLVNMDGTVRSFPAIVAGDRLTVTTAGSGTATSLVMNHTITFNGGVRSVLSAGGSLPEQGKAKGKLTEKITALNLRSNEFERTLDGLSSEIARVCTDEKTGVRVDLATKLQQLADSIELSVSSRYYSQQQMDAILKLQAESLSAEVKRTGGKNLIQNSVGYGGKTGWESDGLSVAENTPTLSKKGFNLAVTSTQDKTVAFMEQQVEAVPGITHTLSFRYRTTGAGTLSIMVSPTQSIPEDARVLDLTADGKLHDHSVAIMPVTSPVTLRLELTDCNAPVLVGDLILCEGVSAVWQQAEDEGYSTKGVFDMNGLSVTQTGSGTRTVIDAAGTKIKELNSETVVASYDTLGTKTKSLRSEGEVQAGRLRMIPIKGKKACMWVINDSEGVN